MLRIGAHVGARAAAAVLPGGAAVATLTAIGRGVEGSASGTSAFAGLAGLPVVADGSTGAAVPCVATERHAEIAAARPPRVAVKFTGSVAARRT
jgi:hypothetical protein